MTNLVTQDYLLNKQITLLQPKHGYRVAIDPVFLAAAVHASPGETVLDVGTGVGAAALCLSHRVPECKIIGLEIQKEYIALAQENIRLNHRQGWVEMMRADLRQPPPRLAAGTFCHVMANPPYLEDDKMRLPVDAGRAQAHGEGSTSLEVWAKFCLLMVKPRGTVTFVHRADRLDHLLSYFSGKMGHIEVYPLWSHEGKPAKRVLVRGRKSLSGPMKLFPGMVLHTPSGDFTPQAEAILRQGQGLTF